VPAERPRSGPPGGAPDENLVHRPLRPAPDRPRLPMTRDAYVAELMRLYLEQPDTPATARRNDRKIAADLHHQGIPLEAIAHAIRLATLRRHQRDSDDPPLEPVRSLAYYRRVLESLTPEAFDPDYIAYIAREHARLLAQLQQATPPRGTASP
jgi:hypothetical protein